ncbi:MAG: PEP-CTERM sorting domain-containing protein [Pseudomonadota bacterium]|nr:PEP-CTERM sorting domain-containing protein [Pseudomonadota bacterium]
MKLSKITAILLAILGMAYQMSASAAYQYATNVIGFSTQWSSSAWSANQALGAPDTGAYGDISTAWAPATKDATLEYLTLGFDTPVYSTGAVIRETYGNGFVYQVDAVAADNSYHTVWSGTDTTAPGTPADFVLSWTTTAFQTIGLKIYVDTNHDLSAWEEIDAVQLSDATAVPEPGTVATLLTGLGLMGFMMRRRKAR